MAGPFELMLEANWRGLAAASLTYVIVTDAPADKAMRRQCSHAG
jgi:hypothetical protein